MPLSQLESLPYLVKKKTERNLTTKTEQLGFLLEAPVATMTTTTMTKSQSVFCGLIRYKELTHHLPMIDNDNGKQQML